MPNLNMFEVAARKKMRFPYKGVVTVEALWDLDLKALDSIFKVLNSQKKQNSEESLLNVQTEEDEVIDVQIDIIKYIVSVKKDEVLQRMNEKEKREKNQKIMEIINEKKNEELRSMSIEDLSKLLSQ